MQESRTHSAGRVATAEVPIEWRVRHDERRQAPQGWASADRRGTPERRNQPMTLAEAEASLPQVEAECVRADAASVSAEAAWKLASAEYEKAEAAWSEARARHMRARASLTKVQSRLAELRPA